MLGKARHSTAWTHYKKAHAKTLLKWRQGFSLLTGRQNDLLTSPWASCYFLFNIWDRFQFLERGPGAQAPPQRKVAHVSR
jgi:hypothetical protein